MRLYLIYVLIAIAFASAGCKSETSKSSTDASGENQIRYAKGLSIVKHNGFSILTVSDPWPRASAKFTYVLRRKNASVPDSLAGLPVITVPVSRIIVTSTTHIPSLEMLGVEQSLVGFPNLSYISSPAIRQLIASGKIKELGSNQQLNTEVAIDLEPDVIVGFGIDNDNPGLRQLEKSGLKVMLNGDWNEHTPLGKAEWIKFFGALYDLNDEANKIFTAIEEDYLQTTAMAKEAGSHPTVLIGGMFESVWNVPRGDSWGAIFIGDAGGNYLWKDTKGTGSLALPLESVIEKAAKADIWIGPGQYSGLEEMEAASAHYKRFDAFNNRNVYMFKKGATGGVLYYELAPNRPDLVLRDVFSMLHPTRLPNHELYFFEKLK